MNCKCELWSCHKWVSLLPSLLFQLATRTCSSYLATCIRESRLNESIEGRLIPSSTVNWFVGISLEYQDFSLVSAADHNAFERNYRESHSNWNYFICLPMTSTFGKQYCSNRLLRYQTLCSILLLFCIPDPNWNWAWLGKYCLFQNHIGHFQRGERWTSQVWRMCSSPQYDHPTVVLWSVRFNAWKKLCSTLLPLLVAWLHSNRDSNSSVVLPALLVYILRSWDGTLF